MKLTSHDDPGRKFVAGRRETSQRQGLEASDLALLGQAGTGLLKTNTYDKHFGVQVERMPLPPSDHKGLFVIFAGENADTLKAS